MSQALDLEMFMLMLQFFPLISKIIWLGDLNYRLASGCADTHELLKKNDWQALLEKDQVRKKKSYCAYDDDINSDIDYALSKFFFIFYFLFGI